MDRRLLILSYTLFLGPFGGVNVILSMMNILENDFSTTLEMVTLSISAAMLPFALLQFVTGALSDAWNAKRTIVAGMSVYCLGAVLCGIAPSIPVFMAGRVLQGVGLAFVNPVALAMVGAIVPDEKRGWVMGWMGTINTLGIAMGPLAGGLAAGINWRIVYYAIIAMSISVIVLFLFAFGEPPERGHRRGSVASNLKEVGSVRAVQIICLAGFAAFLAYGTALTFVSDTLEGPPLNVSSAEMGFAIFLGGVAGIIASPVAGYSADRYGRPQVTLVGFVLATCVYLAFALTSDFQAALSLFFTLGAATSFIWAGLITLSVEMVPGARATSSALFNGTRFTGYALAPILLVPVYTAYGLFTVLMVSVAMAATGALLALYLKRLILPRAGPVSSSRPPPGTFPPFPPE